MVAREDDGAGTVGDGGLEEVVGEILGGRSVAVRRLAVDAYNAHYRVDVDGGRYHMVRYFNRGDRALEGIAFEHAVLIHLERRGFARLPRLFMKDGETVFRRGDDYFAFSEWIEGCATEADRPVTDAQVGGIARCLADLHRAMEGFERRLAFLPEHVFVFPANEVRRRARSLVERLESVAGGGSAETFDDEARAVLRRWLPDVPTLLDRFPWELYEEVREEATQHLVHGDVRLLNLVFDGDEVAKVLDFNASFNEVRLWDLCYTALSLAGTETLGEPRTPERAATFLREYTAEHPLSAAERELLPEFLVLAVTKLMLAAPCSWWVVQRAPLFERLRSGLAEELASSAVALHA